MEPPPRETDDPVGRAVALLPLRTGGKSRLGDALSAATRDQLVLAMLDDVLAAVHGAGIRDVRILAGGGAATGAAHARGLTAVPDPTTDPGVSRSGDVRLRMAVDAALAVVPDDRVRIVLAADLPRLSAAEVASVLAHPAGVVVVPTSGGGTALLRLAAHVRIPARYGPGSAAAHVAAAELAGHRVHVLELAGARHDVDAVSDLADLSRSLDGAAPGRATAAFAAALMGGSRG